MRRALLVWIGLTCWSTASSEVRADDRHFDREIAPLLARRCLSCHAGADAQGGLDLTTFERARRGGDSGSAAITPGHLSASMLWARIDAGEMPPEAPLPDRERALLREWLEAGAAWGATAIDPFAYTSDQRAGYDWWSLQPLRDVTPPTCDPLEATVRNPIDAFIDQARRRQGLTGSGEADRRVLIRRLSFDLLGLPPTPAEVAEFINDPAPNAYEQLVDRLLASPHHGERWARHWLDVVRFGESNGFERDLPRPHAWHYRDWVIAALNRDLPYDEFARWQLAGDVIAPNDPEALKALGFLVAGPHDTVIPVSVPMRQTMRQDELEDVIGVVSQTFLGLTVNCARCHDHKFDPISTREYYQMSAVFAGLDHVEKTVEPAAATDVPAVVSGDGTVPTEQPAAQPKPPAVIIYTAGRNQPSVTKVLQRGSVGQPGDVVAPAGLTAIASWPGDLGLRPDALEYHRRQKLADWVTNSQNPLFARVIVNRLWHYHFGLGLVATPNDLGFQGGPPSHPELLDWLAGELIRSNYSLKHLHRLIVTSATYRQAATYRADADQRDHENRWLWRMLPRRLDAESVRDAMLTVAGELNPQLEGPSVQDFHSYFFKGTQFYDPLSLPTEGTFRRTVYRMWARGGRSPFLDTFDCPDPSTASPQRSSTTTPLQALTLLNNDFTRRMAERLAQRIAADAGDNVTAQVELAFERVFSRPPDDVEHQLSADFVERQGLTAACLAWLNSSAFLYLD